METLYAFTVPTVLHIKAGWAPVHFWLFCVLSKTKRQGPPTGTRSPSVSK